MINCFTPEQVAQILDCEPSTVVERIIDGDLPGVKYGRSWRVPEPALDARLVEKSLDDATERRRAREAKGTATTVIKAAKAGPRARPAPALPSHP